MDERTVTVGGSGGGGLLRVDHDAATAPFEQVREGLSGLITTGRLLPGDRLPTVRGLATDLGVAANTVARAVKELEAAGLVVTGRRAGTTVASGAHASEVVLEALAARFVGGARDAGFGEVDAVDAVRRAFRA
ncbi:GntR family transcriptional regulator [Intrasporangium sp. YIM S08009]|uniref:GntR family transcriptional regulator n=1 Tax=Intrasporangium zincisolvens TaxID=3080018 RepID=UPI002B05C5D3|nr:GntR family transcriptional regulator [Intrasporangium sp. YIM S08009]